MFGADKFLELYRDLLFLSLKKVTTLENSVNFTIWGAVAIYTSNTSNLYPDMNLRFFKFIDMDIYSKRTIFQ